MKIHSKTSSIYTVKPTLIDIGGDPFAKPDTVVQESLIFQVQKVEGNVVSMGIKESDSVLQYVTLKAYKFPYINLLWLGTIIMFIGFMISMAWRRHTNKLKKVVMHSVKSGKEREISSLENR
jgi:cytochrome c-type biogenesis protein CcmF